MDEIKFEFKLSVLDILKILGVFVIVYYALYMFALPELKDLLYLLLLTSIILLTIFLINYLGIPEGEFRELTSKDLLMWFSIGSIYIVLILYFAAVFPDYFNVAILYFALTIFSVVLTPIVFYLLKWQYISIYAKNDIYWIMIGFVLLIELNILYSFLIPGAIFIPAPILMVVIFPFLEEAMFRGTLFIQFSSFNLIFAIIAQSVIFSLFHSYVYHGNIYFITYLFNLAIILSYVTSKSKSILPATIIHTINNFLAVI